MTTLERLLIAVVVFALSIFLAYRSGITAGEENKTAEHQEEVRAYKDAEIKLREQHAVELGRVVQAQNQTNLKNAKDHENALKEKDSELRSARADADRRGGLRIPAPTCPSGNVGANAQTTGTGQRDEGTPTTIQLPARVEDGLWALVSRADDVTEQLRACQGWIQANGFYGEIPPKGD